MFLNTSDDQNRPPHEKHMERNDGISSADDFWKPELFASPTFF